MLLSSSLRAAVLLQVLQRAAAADEGFFSFMSREAWVYFGVLCTFAAGTTVLCCLFKCWRCLCHCRSKVNDEVPVFPDEASVSGNKSSTKIQKKTQKCCDMILLFPITMFSRQWCPDVYHSPWIAVETFSLQVAQQIPVKHYNWPPHRVLIRKVIAEQMERERQARDEMYAQRRARRQGREGTVEERNEEIELEDLEEQTRSNIGF
ncbi:hypothetical protein PRIPAC_86660 [Pristionchus pacificus]|uniref:Uncharacterized protein n=1 Tax=Pristionchus pacificus TaxID=54126 RepID=A0A2A6BL32_PRIPA|nr:hypothetical protein PRIPAC_86660 [Pristionchus pacificus]|eukprot:PDM66491.1 hypothetical protein PRIPAC_47908 [Pristionchus pacificus]